MNNFIGKSIPGIVSEVLCKDSYPPIITIGVLLYGAHPDLARRCLDSLCQLPRAGTELRIGMNEVCEETRNYVHDLFAAESDKGRAIRLYRSTTNRGKYPMMRWMFHDVTAPLRSEYVMWFDDDSYLFNPSVDWLNKITTVLSKADMCGAVMTTGLTAGQLQWIEMQPWYNGKPPEKHVQKFAVGGWWAMRTKVLNFLDWPPRNIVHRGGDYMLGEALRQHDYRLVNFTDGVAINASASGENHKAARRGLDPVPCGVSYTPSTTVALHAATKDIEPVLFDYPNL